MRDQNKWASFNSSQVEQKFSAFSCQSWALSLFQFLIGRIEINNRQFALPDMLEFQFLIGRIEMYLKFRNTPLFVEFQFLIGRIEIDGIQESRLTEPGFNSSQVEQKSESDFDYDIVVFGVSIPHRQNRNLFLLYLLN